MALTVTVRTVSLRLLVTSLTFGRSARAGSGVAGDFHGQDCGSAAKAVAVRAATQASAARSWRFMAVSLAEHAYVLDRETRRYGAGLRVRITFFA
jgi:hypothetical protein